MSYIKYVKLNLFMAKINNMGAGSFLLPPRSEYSSRKDWEKACWDRITKSGKFLETLVTANERRNIVMRAAVAEFVNSGKRPQQISRGLLISRQTINSIRKAIKERNYKSYRERGKTERKKKVWSRHPSKKKPYRRYRRTKYGKVYLHPSL
ncbi:MAG: hypothetical protein UY26_C0003G0013 [Candidatus Jorgensenbacteria bacterium GW2011_GWA1_48_13]|uniref:Uncharacterized protein n=2 Tax=Candidatus Joergenseniibacteriota TaxID=1752739 RepID=A0A0G1Z7M6_9BACT|nr:MAG: hypothetical protein UY26_C0003G0013 [Candidatus Jorgensenbacteria bacterium GW2011_GWA1_48_13]KKU99295.1 MAG: hypothetical protein UY32_C0002G0031 [Candidatus Jorgensenbacteria bacterium GW2011_GWC1_48_8]KKW14974.1 MAG: hypothetical protein UY55_C0002G0030 [Candidatus Jorgensenbacteria bacterium GW2011_GWB1_50_10]